MNQTKIPRSVGTHDGTFHADEVTACALLVLFDLVDVDKIVRTRDQSLLDRCEYVCDVGGIYDPKRHLFDHHQVDYQGPMSSAGMILLYLKESGVIQPKEYDYFNRTLILGVDAHDNGNEPQIRGVCTYSHVISSFTAIPQDVSAEIMDAAFFEALEFARGYLGRIWKRYQYLQECRALVAEAMKTRERYLVFNQSIPWLECFFELGGVNHPAQFVIMPAGSHWKLRGIPPSFEDRMGVRMPLPREWAGLLENDLKSKSGIPGAVFCHKGRFISVWETREDAMKALNYILEQNVRA